MGGLFSSPKKPKVPPPPPPPAPPESVDAAVAADKEATRLRKKKGTASTVLAGEAAPASGSVAKKTLLGS